MDLRQVKKKTTWNDAADVINDNAQIISQKIVSLEAGRGNQKGYFASLEALQSTYPTSGLGDTAYVGTTYPYAIYKYTESGWVNTGATGGEASDAYTKEEANAKFLSKSGGEITGDLKIGVVTISKDSNGYVTIDSDRNDQDAQLDIYAGGGIHLRNNTTVHGALSADLIQEGGKKLYDKYATKEEASSFVNVGRQSNLQAAIAAIPYRVGLQVVTFTNLSSLQRKKIYIRFLGIKDGDMVEVSFNGVSSGTIYAIGGDSSKLNHSIHESIINNEALAAYIYNDSCSDGGMSFTFHEWAKDVVVSVIASSSVTPSVSVLKEYKEIRNESYQLKENTTDDSIFLDTSNWEVYASNDESEGKWNTW